MRTSLEYRIHQLHIKELKSNGSHNSFSYWVDETSPVGPDQAAFIKHLAKISLVKRSLKKWVVTQNLTFKEQLESGIRYFDLRVSSKPEEAGKEIYFIHCLYGIKVWEGLKEINQFLTQHSKEVVLLDFNHFYAMDIEHHLYLVNMIQEVFGSKLCPADCDKDITLQYLWGKKYQVLIFYHYLNEYLFLWPGNKMPAPWANTINVHELIQFLEKTLTERSKRGTFHVSQAILTPKKMTIIRRLKSGLKNTLVHRITNEQYKLQRKWFVSQSKDGIQIRNLPMILKWVEMQKPGMMGVNIITSDFVELVDFAETVIRLNNLLL